MPPFSRGCTRLPPGSSVNSLNSRLFGNKTRQSTSPKGTDWRKRFILPIPPPPLIKLSYFNLFQCVIFSFFCLCAYVNLNLSLVVNAYLAFNVWFLNIKTNCFLYFFFLFIFYVNVANLAHARIMDKKS